MSGRDQRRFERIPVDRDIGIYINGYVMELPSRDISIRGIGLDTCGLKLLRPDDRCLVILTDELEIEARVVSITESSVHFEFPMATEQQVAQFMRQALRS